MKYLIVILLCLPIAELTSASPYVMTKHEFKMKDSDYSKTINHIRFGNSWKTEDGLSLYGEVGIAESINNGSSLGDGDVIKSYEEPLSYNAGFIIMKSNTLFLHLSNSSINQMFFHFKIRNSIS